MTQPNGPPPEDITLCLVVQNRYGNLANALNSVNRLSARMVVVDAGPGNSAVAHLASEYDADYLQVPADPDESALWNQALDRVQSPWALFLYQQEVLHNDDPETLFTQVREAEAGGIAFDLPITHFSEPRNHHFETRIVRTGAGVSWSHLVYPNLDDSLAVTARDRGLAPPAQIMASAAVVSLGEPEYEEWELRDVLLRIEQELDRDAEQVRYWFHLAEVAIRLEEWDRSHAAVEEGLSVIYRTPGIALEEPQAVNGIIGLFCQTMLRSEHYPEKTVQSLLTIYRNMPADGRFAVPLGRLLLAIGREVEVAQVQRNAVDCYFNQRRYHLSSAEGLYTPVMFEWELAWQQTGDQLLKSIVEVQTILKSYNFRLQPILQYIYQHHQKLFFEIQTILQQSLGRPG